MTAIVVTDAGGRVLHWNRGAASLFGYAPEEACGMAVTTLLAGEELSLEELLSDPHSTDGDALELLAVRRDKTVFQCELSCSAFSLADALQWVLVFRNASERSRTELALQRSEDKYRALALYAPVGILECDPQGMCMFVNRRWTEITGVTYDEALGRGWSQAIHPDDLARVRSSWQQAVHTGAPFSIDYRYIARNGEIAWVHGASVPLQDASGATTGYLGSIVDVTERKRALDALAASEASFRSLVESAPFGVLVCRERLAVYANQAFLEMLGFGSLQEIVGRSFFDWVHPQAHLYVKTRADAREAGEDLSPAPIHCIRRDGSELFIEGASTFSVFDGQQAQVIVARDVTEREHAEQQRVLTDKATRDSLREKEVLLKEIHHRVKNNLQVIVSLINLQAAKLEDPTMRAAFEETRGRVHAIALLHERLYGAKNLGRIDMRDYLAGLASDLSSTNLDPRNIELRVEAEELYFEMDTAVPIGLIVNELVTNAYKHAFPRDERRGGKISVALRRVGSEIIITVADDGVGYPHSLDPDLADTLGLLLISSLSRQLEGQVSFEHGDPGARCILRFPSVSKHSSLPIER